MQNLRRGPRAAISTAIRVALAMLVVGSGRSFAQDRGGDPMAGGLVVGEYLRIGAGATLPVSPQGSLRNWSQGTGISLAYENWPSFGAGIGSVGFGITAAYSFLPLKNDFVARFAPPSGGTAESASARSSARILEITSNVRIRIPSPIVMPAVTFGLGFINWAPGSVDYQSSNGTTGNVKYSHRSGAEVSVGGSLDRQLFDRYALYAEAAYVYGFTSFGQGFNVPNSVCSNAGCDPLKNTTFATIRGGLRVGLGR